MQVPVFSFLFGFAGIFEPLDECCQSDQAGFKTLGEHPALLVSVFLVKAADVIYESKAPHLGADSLQGAAAEAVFVRNRFQDRQKLIGRPFQIDEEDKKDFLVVFVMGKKGVRQFVQSFHAADAVVVDVYFGVGCHFAM